MVIKAILFDVDDTLYDFSQTWTNATQTLLQSALQNTSINLHEAWDAFERINRTVFSYVDRGEIPTLIARRLRWELLGAFYDIDKLPVEQLLESHYEAMSNRCVPFPDAQSIIASLATQYQLGIITNGPHDLLDKRLQSVGLSHYFPPNWRIAADRVGRFKPDPEIFRIALEKMNLAPDEVLFIGDSWKYDIIGAQQAQIPAIWYNPTESACPDTSLIVSEIKTLKELPIVLETLP